MVELSGGQLGKKAGVGFIRQRVFSCLGRVAVIKIAVRQHQLAGANFLQQGAVTVGGCINALDIHVFRLRGRVIEPQSFEGTYLGHKAQ